MTTNNQSSKTKTTNILEEVKENAIICPYCKEQYVPSYDGKANKHDKCYRDHLKNTTVDVCVTVKTSTPFVKSPHDLYDDLIEKYDEINRTGIERYEFYSAHNTQVKPHIDYEEMIEIEKYNDAKSRLIKDNVLLVMTKIFNTTNDKIAICCDTRIVKKKIKNKKTKNNDEIKNMYKISYHFVVVDQKCDILYLKEYIESKLGIFENHNLLGVDTKIYRNGINKFRCPYSTKDSISEGALMIPLNFKKRDDFHNHLVSFTYLCEDKKFILDDKKPMIKSETNYNDIKKESYDDIKNIINKYDVISIREGFDNYEGIIFYDVSQLECGNDHDNNHNYLIHNVKKDTLKIKCHSKRCNNFEKTLYVKRSPTKHFSIKYFNNIQLKDGQKTNYYECRDYFEQFHFLSMYSNTIYAKYYVRDRRTKRYKMDIKPVVQSGLYSALFFKEIMVKEKGENFLNEKCRFIKAYMNDPFKKIYSDTKFEPIGYNESIYDMEDDGQYNLFDGFGYQKILSVNEQNNIPKEKYDDLKFVLRHIQYYICGYDKALKTGKEDDIKLSINLFNYLLMFIQNMIEDPSFIPQILLVFYSPEKRTGKSEFTKFLSRLIGNEYSSFVSFQALVDSHANYHYRKILNFVEEVNRKETYKHHQFIKDKVQQEDAILNEKNKPAKTIQTYVRYIMTTNYYDGLYMETEARRPVVYTFEKRKNKDDVDRYIKCINDPYVIYLFGKYLELQVESKYKKVREWTENRPLTDDYYRMRSGDIIDCFLTSLIDRDENVDIHPSDFKLNDNNKNKVIMSLDIMYELYKVYCDKNNNGKKKGKQAFDKHLDAQFKESMKKLPKSRKLFNRKICYEINLKKIHKKLVPYSDFKNRYSHDYLEDLTDDESDVEQDTIVSYINKNNKINKKLQEEKDNYLDNEFELFMKKITFTK